jgi:capsular polysaccharide biosynthesis protein
MLFKNSRVDRSEPKRHWLIVISLIVSVVVLTVGVAIAIEHLNDRLLSAQLIQSEVEPPEPGLQI